MQTLNHILLATMQIKLLCSFLLVTLVGCTEFGTTGTVPAICKEDPPQEQGRANHRGWFYDYNIDACLVLIFGAPRAENEVVNRFETREQCSKTCRPHVKSFCFDDPPKTSHGKLNRKWFYNSTQAKCFMISINGKAPKNTNVFNTEAKCNKICRDPDFGDCAVKPPETCHESDTEYYRYDLETGGCYHDTRRRCPGRNAFPTSDDCYKHCERFVPNKCKQVPLNISAFCSTYGNRYYYDQKQKRCKSFVGSDDHGIGFYNLTECEKSCPRDSKSG
uniref:Putative secreted salivary gland peptide ixodes scapularis secreted salivary gland peptide n=2 Tax=Ixodes ricinus TaxID=34613 RepID=A0A090X923_IXORI